MARDVEAEDAELDEAAPVREEAPFLPGLRAGGLSLGFLAMIPMLVVYEWGIRKSASGLRNTSELFLFLPFSELGIDAATVRVAALVVVAVVCTVLCYRRRIALIPGLFRVVAEGVVAALLFGPALVLLVRALDVPVPAGALGGPAGGPDPVRAAVLFGGGAYEEILFRVLAYGLVFLLAARVVHFFAGDEKPARVLADGFALTLSAVLFAAFHLEALTGFLGLGGEPFDAGVFTWRFLAGILLGLLFRWRGPGVAGWTHGLFNLAVVLGAGPEVLL